MPNVARQKEFITGDSLSHYCVARRLVLKMHASLLCFNVTLHWLNLFLNCTSTHA